MTEHLKIGYLVPQFPGQTHIFFWREILAMEERGADVHIFSTRLPSKSLISHDWSDAAIARTTYLGVPSLVDFITSLARAPWGELGKAIAKDQIAILKDILICLPAARRLVRDCQAHGITHVHAHSCGRAALIAALANRMSGIEYSVTLHGPLQDYGVGQEFKWRRASFATIITKKLLAEIQISLEGNLPNRLHIQPMGVDTLTLKREAPYTPPKSGNPVKLFSCARLNVVKGHQDLMKAVRILIDQGFDIKLEIAGEDDDGGTGFRKELQAELERLNLDKHVRLLGAIDAKAVHSRLLDADIFVLASWSEPLGVAYMEAMSCGVPTIGTNAGGVPELITDDVDGILVEPQAPQELANAILRVIDNPELAKSLSKNGRQRIETAFRSTLGAEVLMQEISELPK